MNSADEPIAISECRACGQRFTYEPIIVGDFDLAKSLHTYCQTCKEASKAIDDQRRAKDRRAEIEARIIATIEPDLLATDVNYPGFNRALWAAVSQWCPTPQSFWMAIIGEADKSKTRCMAKFAMKIMHSGTRIVWTTANLLKDACDDRKSIERTISSNARELISDCMTAPWLFIDDLGKNEWGRTFESQFFQILNHRKNHLLPMVYSSNAHPEDFGPVISNFNRSPIIGRLLDRTTIFDLTPQ